MFCPSRIRRLLLPILALVLLPCPAVARPIDPAAVDALAPEALKSFHVPGAAVAVIHGDDAFLKGYGLRELSSENAVTADTIFAIGSCTKAFTTTAIAILADDGKLKWDDPVRKHVEFFRLADPLADRDVTLRDLVTHRTGMSGHNLLYRRPWSLEETVRRIGHLPPSTSFRSTYEYNNVMYIAAGFAIAGASGSPWHEFVQKRIFDPLEMRAVFTSSAAQKAADHASPHLRAEAGKVQMIPWYDDDGQIRASGSIKASVRDLSKWARLQLAGGTANGKRIISEAGLRETHTPQMVRPLTGRLPREMESTQASYGLGWMVVDYRGHLLVEHGGAVDGFRAHLTLVPREKLAVVVLCNLGSTEFPAALARSLLDLSLGLKKKDWNSLHAASPTPASADLASKRRPGTKPSREPESYAATYEHSGYGTLTIAKEKDGLALRWSTFHLRLEHYHYDTFITRSDDLRDRGRVGNELVVFKLGADGEVTGLRFLGQEFRKK